MRHLHTQSLRALLLLAAFIGSSVFAQTPPVVRPAIDGVFAAFAAHPLVGIGDSHGLAQELDFYAAIVRDPRFAQQVGNVVVEFGAAAHQDIIDRYVNGEDLPYTEVRKVWSNTVGAIPLNGSIGFMNFYAQVRATNLALPPEQRIKVWLGEPPIDWSKVTTNAEFQPFLAQRNSYPADLILNNVLAKNKKALVIYGNAHLAREKPKGVVLRTEPLPGSQAALRKLLTDGAEGKLDPTILSPGLLGRLQRDNRLKSNVSPLGAFRSANFRQAEPYGTGDVFNVEFAKETRIVTVLLDDQGRIDGYGFRQSENPKMLVDLVEAKHADAFYVVAPYTGLEGRPCEALFEQVMNGWPKPALVSTVRMSTLPNVSKAAGCELDLRMTYADAMLFVGRGPELFNSALNPDVSMDGAFRKEISRRNQIMTGQPLGPLNVEFNPATPIGFRRTPR
jgi:hypothetical protein